jgi:chemotaxis protein MotB
MAKPKRRKRTAPGVPAWVVTFGDMMALLLVFFILIVMFSELKREHEYQRVITAVKEAFGYAGGIGVLPIDHPPLRSIVEQLEQLALKQLQDSKISQSDTPGIDGPEMRVKTVRDGIVFVIGGASTFDEFSAEVLPAVHRELDKLAVLLAGRNNKVVIRGHAASKYIPAGTIGGGWADVEELSFYRARAVRDVLVELGLNERVFRIEAVADREPVRPRAVHPIEAAENRRVEIILTQQLVEEMNTDWLGTDPELARGQ